MKIIDKSLESDYFWEYVALTILSILVFKRLRKLELKRKSLRKEMKEKKEKKYQV